MTSKTLEGGLLTIRCDLEDSFHGKNHVATRKAVIMLLDSIIGNGYPAGQMDGNRLYQLYFEDYKTGYAQAKKAVDGLFYSAYGVYLSDRELLEFALNVIRFCGDFEGAAECYSRVKELLLSKQKMPFVDPPVAEEDTVYS